jgi:hypothetical protein
MTGDDGPVTDFNSTHHAGFFTEPAIVSDFDRRLDDSLFTDRLRQIVVPMVEIADVDPVRENALASDLDIKVSVDRVLAAEHALVADAQVPLMAPDGVARTYVHPFAKPKPSVSASSVDLCSRFDKNETISFDPRFGDLEPKEPEQHGDVSGQVQAPIFDESNG